MKKEFETTREIMDIYGGAFIYEDDLAKKFCEKNKLGNSFKIEDAKEGVVVRIDNKNHFYLKQTTIRDGMNSMYDIASMKYTLKGKLNDEKISLEAKVSYSKKYKMQPTGFPRPMIQEHQVEVGKNITKERIDKNKEYWFIKKV